MGKKEYDKPPIYSLPVFPSVARQGQVAVAHFCAPSRSIWPQAISVSVINIIFLPPFFMGEVPRRGDGGNKFRIAQDLKRVPPSPPLRSGTSPACGGRKKRSHPSFAVTQNFRAGRIYSLLCKTYKSFIMVSTSPVRFSTASK